MNAVDKIEHEHQAKMPDTSGMSLAKSQIAWATAVQQGCSEAWRPLFESMRKWVFKFSKRIMLGRVGAQASSDLMDDLMAEAEMMIFANIERFNPSVAGWMTWSTWFVRAAVGRFISSNQQTVRLPFGAQELATKIRKFSESYLSVNGREPQDAEIIREFEISKYTLTIIHSSNRKMESVDAPAFRQDSYGMTNLDRLPCKKPVAIETVLEDEQAARVRKAVALLSQEDPKLGRVISAHFGLNTEERTFADIGRSMGLSRERIRQLETIALSRLYVLMHEVDATEPVTKPASKHWMRINGLCVRCMTRKTGRADGVCTYCTGKLTKR